MFQQKDQILILIACVIFTVRHNWVAIEMKMVDMIPPMSGACAAKDAQEKASKLAKMMDPMQAGIKIVSEGVSSAAQPLLFTICSR